MVLVNVRGVSACVWHNVASSKAIERELNRRSTGLKRWYGWLRFSLCVVRIHRLHAPIEFTERRSFAEWVGSCTELSTYVKRTASTTITGITTCTSSRDGCFYRSRGCECAKGIIISVIQLIMAKLSETMVRSCYQALIVTGKMVARRHVKTLTTLTQRLAIRVCSVRIRVRHSGTCLRVQMSK